MPELRREWVCTGCAMRVYNACHDAIPAPGGWDAEADRCAACVKSGEIADTIRTRREAERATDAALTEALTSEPTRSDTDIAKQVGIKKTACTEKRQALGLPDLQTARREAKKAERAKSGGEKQAAARKRLLEDPSLTNAQLTAELGFSTAPIRAARRELGLPDGRTKAARGLTPGVGSG
jgi:hypothetical protein